MNGGKIKNKSDDEKLNKLMKDNPYEPGGYTFKNWPKDVPKPREREEHIIEVFDRVLDKSISGDFYVHSGFPCPSIGDKWMNAQDLYKLFMGISNNKQSNDSDSRFKDYLEENIGTFKKFMTVVEEMCDPKRIESCRIYNSFLQEKAKSQNLKYYMMNKPEKELCRKAFETIMKGFENKEIQIPIVKAKLWDRLEYQMKEPGETYEPGFVTRNTMLFDMFNPEYNIRLEIDGIHHLTEFQQRRIDEISDVYWRDPEFNVQTIRIHHFGTYQDKYTEEKRKEELYKLIFKVLRRIHMIEKNNISLPSLRNILEKFILCEKLIKNYIMGLSDTGTFTDINNVHFSLRLKTDTSPFIITSKMDVGGILSNHAEELKYHFKNYYRRDLIFEKT